ncbi:related to SEH-associated protein 4 [Saccharomycodes ludwigii]|uniref:Related to SEH-associated protein 4 n=1 Tax=Saccharomycodes ludwigii TaxID=36035 RepID=A0A376B5X1_9ASCO|nr:hypothetical protein SCDLUD_000124 [Saccharomycodes ludwigii]KAH3902545.1 hypothetical protein SCDLUD_000124 [Saccharomycodes ludwigii]SSD59959.1 related to SEH-associated protein 4 [Saccharomycodes ludwigii]
MAIFKQAPAWVSETEDYTYYLSVNPTKDEVGLYKVFPEGEDEDENSIQKLNTLKDFRSISCLDYSKINTGMTCTGEKNGIVKVFNVFNNSINNNTYLDGSNNHINHFDKDSDSLTSEINDFILDSSLTQEIVVRAKQQRSITDVSFSDTGNLIAMGLEKHKHDYSLQIWDVNYQSTENNVVNTSFQYFPNESILSLKFIGDTNLLCSSLKFLREIDLRSPKPVFQIPISVIHSININPFNPLIFATRGDDGTSAIWDRRKLNFKKSTIPLLKFDKILPSATNTFGEDNTVESRNNTNRDTTTSKSAKVKKTSSSLFRWSALREEEFSTLHNGTFIKRWRLGYVPSTENATYESLFVSTVNDVFLPFDRVSAFDYIPRANNKTSYICMRQSGTVYRCSVDESCSFNTFNSLNDLMVVDFDKPDMTELRIGDYNEKKTLEQANSLKLNDISFDDLDNSDLVYSDRGSHIDAAGRRAHNRRKSSVVNKDGDESATSNVNSRKAEEQDYFADSAESDVDYVLTRDDLYLVSAETLLTNDISMLIRERAILGYGLDPMKSVLLIDNMKSLQNNAYIRNTWRWLAIAKNSVDDETIISQKLDLGYEGVLGIWNGLDGLSKQNRCKHNVTLTEKELNIELEKIIKKRRKNGRGVSEDVISYALKSSAKAVQRKLCLIVSGWDLSESEIEEKYVNLVKANQYEKAAGWAVFFGDIPKAIEILSNAKRERLRLIATAVAGYLAYKDDIANNTWREQCRKMASELDDPYLRAIFAYIADNDWWDILYDSSISLRERLGVALRFLSDRDLSMFLNKIASTVISNGELEGLILTGLTPSGIDLLQSYVDKTSDVQTAALISVYGSPRYFYDPRADKWVQIYKDMLNSWELFTIRSKFDILRTKLSRTRNGEITTKMFPRQLYIQCFNCKHNINKPRNKVGTVAKKKRNGDDSVKNASIIDATASATASAQLTSSCSSSALTIAAAIPNNATTAATLSTSHSSSLASSSSSSSSSSSTVAGTGVTSVADLERIPQKYSCSHCGAPFPRCAICLLPLGTSNLPIVIEGSVDTCKMKPTSFNDGNRADLDERRRLKLNEWFSFCLSCNHGMHAGHAEEWFERHYICPVPGCSCQCNK